MPEPNTVKGMQPAVGATVCVRFEELAITCTVIDVKNAWGKVRLEVKPHSGYGSQWIELSRLVQPPQREITQTDIERMKADGYLGAGWTR